MKKQRVMAFHFMGVSFNTSLLRPGIKKKKDWYINTAVYHISFIACNVSEKGKL